MFAERRASTRLASAAGSEETIKTAGSPRTLVKLVVKDEFEQRDRFMRENLDAMARKLGEMQAKVVQLESLGERVYGLAGLNPADIRALPGQGGALISGRPLSMEEFWTMRCEMSEIARRSSPNRCGRVARTASINVLHLSPI